MAIFRLLSEEVFDFSQDQMISEKAKRLKTAMCNEFPLIFNLFSQILADAHQSSLIKATLETLLRFLNWIPLGYAFDQKIITKLLDRFLMVPDFMNLTLKCLTEIGSVQIGSQYLFDETLVQMFTNTLLKVSEMIPSPLDLKQTYATSNSREQEFILNLTLFLCNFFSVHLNVSFILCLTHPAVFSGVSGESNRDCSRYCSSSKNSPIPTSSFVRIFILSVLVRSKIGKFSRSASSTGQNWCKSCTRKCNSFQSQTSTP